MVGALKPETVYLLNVSAADGRGLANLIVVNITVLDVNDHKPTFVKPEYSFTILEGNYKEQRSRLGVLRAVDDDRGKNGAVDYAIISRKDQSKCHCVRMEDSFSFLRKFHLETYRANDECGTK